MTRRRDYFGICIAAIGTVVALFLWQLGDPAAPSVNEVRCPAHDACMGATP